MAKKREKKEKKQRKPVVRVLLWIANVVIGIVLLAFLIVVGGLTYLTATEYKPDDIESVKVDISETSGEKLTADGTFTIMTWNAGYGALGDNADFFMDGGEGVTTATKERVKVNLSSVASLAESNAPDFIFFQEVDKDSKRSYHTDECDYIKKTMSQDYVSTFANNFKVNYVPYPIPTIGEVDSGIFTLSKYEITDAERISLPCPFDWPVRTANLKRCLLVSRVPVYDADGNDTGKELVLINLHLEAYDSGEGKKAQTEQLKNLLEDEYEKGNYVIAGGDFNQKFSNIDTSMYPEYEGMWQCGEIDSNEFSEKWQLMMDSNAPTCRSLDKPYANADKDTFQYYMIDGFIVSDNIEIESCETLDYHFAGTDHNPVVMKVNLKNENTESDDNTESE